MRIFGLLAMYLLALCFPRAVVADILDAETWDNHIEQIDQMNTANQYRRTMNRFAGVSRTGSGEASSGPTAAQEMAAWKRALVLPPSTSHHELDAFLAKAKVPRPTDRRALRIYMLHRFAAYPAEARQASPALDPQNVVDARLFALQTAYLVVRPTETISAPASLLLSVSLSRQMTQAFNAHGYSAAQKQDARDYYVIIRAFIQPALQHISEIGPIDANTRRELEAFAHAFLVKDTAVDPTRVSWEQLPCLGISTVECQMQMAIARSSISR